MSNHSIWIFLALAGCCLNAFVIEMMIKLDSGAGVLVTFLQFVFISLIYAPGFVRFRDQTTRHFRISFKTRIPLKQYFLINILFFVANVAGNKAFDLNVTQPFVLIFRSLSVFLSFVIDKFWLKNVYTKDRITAILAIPTGMFITFLGEIYVKSGMSRVLQECCSSMPWTEQAYLLFFDRERLAEFFEVKDFDQTAIPTENLLKFFGGVVLLLCSVFALTVLGYVQNYQYRTYKHSVAENTFYSHLLLLPMFLFLAPDIRNHITIWNSGLRKKILGFFVPWVWHLAVINICSQVVCINSVQKVNTHFGALACNIVTTLRKYISLIFSIWYFQNTFTVFHIFGFALVSFGCIYLFLSKLHG
ncbi:UDP-N-acetylglucosamine transporter slc35b4-like [Schistocerca gregaria]|uniref:UDP-N-acetylglucosamine transporter slc35b4-like n=1 Tax=Schistocerca gregaria TaxID=7010 RepID=UPI00211E3524|nr:UDP-N-acetylglucosamine transporter slc35b4-like [Schistocerca gregaria]